MESKYARMRVQMDGSDFRIVVDLMGTSSMLVMKSVARGRYCWTEIFRAGCGGVVVGAVVASSACTCV